MLTKVEFPDNGSNIINAEFPVAPFSIKTEFIFLFEELTNYIYKDFNSNPYICKYYLSMPEETIHFHALDFLGEGEKRLDVFRGILERIQKEKEQYV